MKSFIMLLVHLLLILLYINCGLCQDDPQSGFERIRTRTSDSEQENTVRGMIERRIPDHFNLFEIEVQSSLGPSGKDTFKILPSVSPTNESLIKIIGNSGVAASYGFLYYLKNYCNAHVSWEADQLELPSVLPLVNLEITSKDSFRYYQNVCTVSYTFVWWDWNRWERHIDWMAMNGINLPLAFTGQEAIWSRVYLKMNLTQQELDDHFAGPPFLAWGRMGNIRKYGGPLSESWLEGKLALQHQILERMRGFGMTPVLPAFAGHVPEGITRVYPDANVTQLRNWAGFPDEYTRTFLLDPTDPLFLQIGSDFIRELQIEFNGTDHYYNCDTFNEMSPPSDSPEYLSSVSDAIYTAITTEDPDAIWVMQGWLFRNDGFWTYNATKALLTAVPLGRMLLLDLASDIGPVYQNYESFFGQPFIFCMLHNFGGNKGMYGAAQTLLVHLEEARSFPNTTLEGVGITMEGIEQNYVMYDFMLELGWKEPQEDISLWAKAYSSRRYGNYSQDLLGEAWRLLMNGVYDDSECLSFHGDHILMMHRPDFDRMPLLWYNVSDVITSWDLMIQAAKISDPRQYVAIGMNNNHFKNNFVSKSTELNSKETFQHDLVDLTRQVLQIRGDRLIQEMRFFYTGGSQIFVNESSSRLLEMLTDLDELLGTSPDFLLGRWVRGATDWSSNEQEKEQFIENCLSQITIWGPNGELVDYAVKQYNGILTNYVIPRWQLFTQYLLQDLKNETNFNQSEFNEEVFETVEKPFTLATNVSYPDEPTGDPVQTAISLYDKYRKYFENINITTIM